MICEGRHHRLEWRKERIEGGDDWREAYRCAYCHEEFVQAHKLEKEVEICKKHARAHGDALAENVRLMDRLGTITDLWLKFAGEPHKRQQDEYVTALNELIVGAVEKHRSNCPSSANHSQCELEVGHEGKHSTHVHGTLSSGCE